jgi:hypothetical protein
MSTSAHLQCTSYKLVSATSRLMSCIRYKPGSLVDLALEVAGIRGNARALNFREHSKEWNILSQFFKNVVVDIKLPKKTVTKRIVSFVEAAGRFEFKFLLMTVAVSLPITFILNIVNGHLGTLLQNVQHTFNISRHHWH